MAVEIRTLPFFAATRDGLVAVLAMADAKFARASFSFDPDSDYRRAEAVIDATLLQLRALAIATLQRIDEEIAASDLVGEFNRSAAAAEEEAERMRDVAHTLEDIANVLGRLTRIVSGVAGLL